MFDLAGLLGGAGTILGGILGNSAAERARRDQLDMIERIMFEQRKNLADAKNQMILARQRYENDPRRAELQDKYAALAERGGPYSPGMVSTLKSQTSDQIGRNTLASMAALRDRLAKAGMSGTGVANAAYGQIANNANTATIGAHNKIALDTARVNEDYKRSALDAYRGYVAGDQKTLYGAASDYASLLGSVDYGNFVPRG